MFERESRREKIIEGKMREIRLRVRTRQSEAHSALSRDTRPTLQAMSAADNLLRTAETDFFTIIDEVSHRYYTMCGSCRVLFCFFTFSHRKICNCKNIQLPIYRFYGILSLKGYFFCKACAFL